MGFLRSPFFSIDKPYFAVNRYILCPSGSSGKYGTFLKFFRRCCRYQYWNVVLCLRKDSEGTQDIVVTGFEARTDIFGSKFFVQGSLSAEIRFQRLF
jgi:hypothetical protein